MQWCEERQRWQCNTQSGQTTRGSGETTSGGAVRQEAAACQDVMQQTARTDERQPHQRMRGAQWGARVKSSWGRDDHH
jgi:hypothetical protein